MQIPPKRVAGTQAEEARKRGNLLFRVGKYRDASLEFLKASKLEGGSARMLASAAAAQVKDQAWANAVRPCCFWGWSLQGRTYFLILQIATF